MGIKVIGTLGVVLNAKKKAYIPSAGDVLRSLRTAGLWLDDNTIRLAIEGVDEAAEQDA